MEEVSSVEKATGSEKGNRQSSRTGLIWSDKPHNFFGLSINFTKFMLTSDKLVTRRGFINMTEDELMLYRVVDKKLEFPLSQRIFGCGTIILRCKDSDTPEKILKSVKKPREVSELISEAIVNARRINRVNGRDMYGAMSNEGDIGGFDGDGDGFID